MQLLGPPPPRVTFVLGKPIRDGTVIAEVVDRLRRASANIAVHLPKGDHPFPPWLLESDLIVQRGLGMDELRAARPMEDAGIRCCNRIAATMTLIDRARTFQTLTEADVPTPKTRWVGTWREVVALAGEQPLVVKLADGAAGRGVGVWIAPSSELPAQPPFAGPYIVQDFVRGDGRDHKVYVAGRHASGLLKRSAPRQPAEPFCTPFAVDATLADLSRRVGAALDLDIYGVDFVYGARGPEVVDVNPFPGFRGVADAGRQIADLLTTLVAGQETT
ncbi:MAG: ATP-grasp domain-containing protein [Thermomicrobiales bacterium]